MNFKAIVDELTLDLSDQDPTELEARILRYLESAYAEGVKDGLERAAIIVEAQWTGNLANGNQVAARIRAKYLEEK